MNDYQEAAMIVGKAADTKAKQNALCDKIATWAEDNPYMVYGDYRDELSEEQIEALLEDRQKFDELWWKVEIHASDYVEWSYVHDELIDEFGEELVEVFAEELGEEDPDSLKFDDLPEEAQQAFWEYSWVDCSDLLDTCLRNSSPKIAATVMDPDAPEAVGDGDSTIGPPNGHDLDEEVNEARQKYLADKFGIDGWKAESCYYHETLKVMGTLDLRDVYRNGKPKAVEIGPDSQLIFHTGWNGSGCLGEVKATRPVTLPARFDLDNGRYGIDAVYGFVGSVWRDEIAVAEWEEWQ